ncbi:Mannose-6-phosphate receptor binding domain,Low-density lipoprotein (LDL) receptor class A repeat,EF-Hand [Cinara cedri]|uniref:Glucosidase 2 subunit beta n=1 Tax=Cinara cedri TaxID=506608 RepID=A0A5E4N769_9HEMI|nr:Mannose-6-phosphate receptor binding domain,Low-density lipoprotein (LDL) receptor class A repeat,EF-Hand [Cinara cedri]
METYHKSIVTLIFYSTVLTKYSVENVEIKGVSIENAKLYATGKDFSCLDGSIIIPNSYINDDYCDCPDASDEPGTSACPNGTFYCKNKGHLPLILPSSRVNDGICDCCDGSDEWANKVRNGACENTCKELGHTAKIELNRVDNLYARGFEIRAKMIPQGKHLLLKKQNAIIQLLPKKKDAQFIRSNTFNDLKIAEENEKKAIEQEKLLQKNEALKIFNKIDTNKNRKIEVSEVIVCKNFDQNKDGLISQDEINYFMENKKEMDLKDFMTNSWSRVKLLILAKLRDVKYPAKINILEEGLNKYNNYNVNNETGKHKLLKDIEMAKINDLLYTEKTKILINESKRCREQFEEVDRKYKDILKTITALHISSSKDFGPENEFAVLDGQCYELTDREYIFKICLFEKVTQRPLNGGPEVNLGVWNNWTNSVNDEPKYHTMLYDKGQYCLNRFQRFTYVLLTCGLEPKLISVKEPNICEYLMEFELPSVCVLEDSIYTREPDREEL